jgi:hypothetical protein
MRRLWLIAPPRIPLGILYERKSFFMKTFLEVDVLLCLEQKIGWWYSDSRCARLLMQSISSRNRSNILFRRWHSKNSRDYSFFSGKLSSQMSCDIV